MSEKKAPALPSTQRQATQYLEFNRAAIARKTQEIAGLNARIAEIEALAPTLPEAAASSSGPAVSADVGDVVRCEFGRAPNRKEVEATVVGVKTDPDTGKVTALKVQYGDGFDAETQVIRPGQVKSRF